MASHLSDLGYRFESKQELYEYLEQARGKASVYTFPRGRYAMYEAGTDGLQLWYPLDENDEPLTWDPHFDSGKGNDVRVLDCIQADPGGLSGLYACEVDIDDGAGMPITEVPVNLHLPAAGLMGDLQPGAWYRAQIAGFAGCAGEPEEEYSSPGIGQFIPVGTFSPTDDPDFEPSPLVMLLARVLSSRRLTNPDTGFEYDHLEVNCLGLMMDLLCDPRLYERLPEPGSLIEGVFWLSAVLWREEDLSSDTSED